MGLFHKPMPSGCFKKIFTYLDPVTLFQFQKVSSGAFSLMNNCKVLEFPKIFSVAYGTIMGHRTVRSTPEKVSCQWSTVHSKSDLPAIVGKCVRTATLFVQAEREVDLVKEVQLFVIRQGKQIAALRDLLFIGVAQGSGFAWDLKNRQVVRFEPKQRTVRVSKLNGVLITNGEKELSDKERQAAFQDTCESVFNPENKSQHFLQDDLQLYTVTRTCSGYAMCFFKVIGDEMQLLQTVDMRAHKPEIRGEMPPTGKFSMRVTNSNMYRTVTCDEGIELGSEQPLLESINECSPPGCFHVHSRSHMVGMGLGDRVCTDLQAFSMTEAGRVDQWSAAKALTQFDDVDVLNSTVKHRTVWDNRFVAVVSLKQDSAGGYEGFLEAFDRQDGGRVFPIKQVCIRTINSVWLQHGRLFLASRWNEISCWDLNAGGLFLGKITFFRDCREGTVENTMDVCALSEKEVYVMTTELVGKMYRTSLTWLSADRFKSEATKRNLKTGESPTKRQA